MAVIDKISKALQKIFGTRNERVLKRYWGMVDLVNSLEDKYRKMSDSELSAMTDKFKERITGGEDILEILPDAFAAIREASDRHLGIRNVFVDEFEFDVSQLSGPAATTYNKLKAEFDGGVALDDLDVDTGRLACLDAVLPRQQRVVEEGLDADPAGNEDPVVDRVAPEGAAARLWDPDHGLHDVVLPGLGRVVVEQLTVVADVEPPHHTQNVQTVGDRLQA